MRNLRIKRTGVIESNDEESNAGTLGSQAGIAFAMASPSKLTTLISNFPPFASRMTGVWPDLTDLRSALALGKKGRVDTCCVAV